ncbi:fatty acyl-CoA reductase 3-like [Tripterygium wilfordii]|uniref:Fatty acyl-CoA reductase n=1 Tax=Tripterygium wilfordii TaxID=458696 RepID=A0A7J7DEW3_TRIWF|nr:fatty acyl-CoA reductase 3-like [Tripterygium wilfordii]
MEPGRVVEFLENKTILLTGVTGFLAKVLLEKIMRSQPNVKKLYLVLRAENATAATQRLLDEVFSKELFRIVRERWGTENFDTFLNEKVIAVVGDVSSNNLGINDSNLREEMWREIDFIISSAATTRFIERYDVALETNTFGAVNVINFATRCVKVDMLLHVSTAYVCGEREGLVPEKSFYMGETLKDTTKLNIYAEKKLVEENLKQLNAQNATDKTITSTLRDLGMKRAKMHGWPNTYSFTKAMGEMVLGEYRESMSLIIIRPPGISSTYKEPFPGWIEGLRTMDAMVIGYGKGQLKCFLGGSNTVLDMIPADMVVNTILIAMVAHANQTQSIQIVYHVGSSLRNPLTLSNIHKFTKCYFHTNPLINKNGKPIKVNKFKFLNSMAKFRIYMTARYALPLKGLHLVNVLSGQRYNDTYRTTNKKFSLLMGLVEIYRPYVLFKDM